VLVERYFKGKEGQLTEVICKWSSLLNWTQDHDGPASYCSCSQGTLDLPQRTLPRSRDLDAGIWSQECERDVSPWVDPGSISLIPWRNERRFKCFLLLVWKSFISSHLSVFLNDHFLCHCSYIPWSHSHLTHINLEDGGSRLLPNLRNHRQDLMLSPPRGQKSEQSHHENLNS